MKPRSNRRLRVEGRPEDSLRSEEKYLGNVVRRILSVCASPLSTTAPRSSSFPSVASLCRETPTLSSPFSLQITRKTLTVLSIRGRMSRQRERSISRPVYLCQLPSVESCRCQHCKFSRFAFSSSSSLALSELKLADNSDKMALYDVVWTASSYRAILQGQWSVLLSVLHIRHF